MAADLDRLVDVLAREAVAAMAPGVVSHARLAGTWGQIIDEPHLVASAAAAHPRYGEAANLVGAEPSLLRLAPSLGTPPVRIVAIDHSQGAPSAQGLVSAMIGAASAELRCLAIAPSADALSGAALKNLQRLRLIGSGEPATVPTFFGFSGLFLEPDQPLDLPWGKLSSAVGWYGLGEMFGPRPTSSVLTAEHSLDISITSGAEPNPSDPVFQRHHDWAQLTARLVILAIVLGTSPDHVACVPTFEMTVLPYELPATAGSQLVLAPPAVERKLTASEGHEIERWARLLVKRYATQLETAARRISTAVSQRIDPADRLIDAVTAWESLFSANQDASLRITGSIAWLLQPEIASARGVLQKEVGRIYSLRSDVVHGRTTEPATVYNLSMRATELAVAAMAALLERRPDLIPIESKDRSRRLLLGLP